jgi:hypothetical protein
MSLLQEFINKLENKDNFENVKKHLEKKNLIVKEQDNLYLVKYNRNTCDLTSQLVLQCRGIILEKVTNQIVCYPINGSSDNQTFKNNHNWNDIVIEESIDGTLVNLFYYNGQWKVSTKSTIDANCYWHNEHKTFKELFLEILDNIKFNFGLLDNNFSYSFVLCHPEARNVTKYSNPIIYHISSRDLNTLKEKDIDIGITKPRILKLGDNNELGIDNYLDLDNLIKNIDYNTEGYMLYTKDRLYRTKFKGDQHNYVKELKGNQPNILFRLLEIRTNENKLKDFLTYFPEYFDLATNIEVAIDELAQAILYFYTKVKKNKENIIIPQLYQKPIIELHQSYIKLMNKYNPKKHSYKPSITLAKIIHYLNYEIDTKYLFHLITYHDKEK